MTKTKLLSATALLATAIATPAMAQPALQEPGAYAQAHPWANDYDYNYRYGRSGFWPADVAAGVVVGAIDTAEAIATAPYRVDDSYAYYGGGSYYANRHVNPGNTCGLQPGATYMGPDGRWYPC